MLRNSFALALCMALTLLAAAVAEEGPKHAIAGELKKVDRDGKKIVIKTADGTEEAVSYTQARRFAA